MKFTLENVIMISGIISILIGVGFLNWLNILKGTNKLLTDQNDALKKSLAALQANYDLLQTSLTCIQQEVATLKDIPLVEIKNALTSLVSSNATTLEINSKILHRLTLDSRTLAKDTVKLATASSRVAVKLREHDERKGE